MSRRRVTLGVARGRRTEEETVRRSWRMVMEGRRVVMKVRSGSALAEAVSWRAADSLALERENVSVEEPLGEA